MNNNDKFEKHIEIYPAIGFGASCPSSKREIEPSCINTTVSF
jgi:hypothetical protein